MQGWWPIGWWLTTRPREARARQTDGGHASRSDALLQIPDLDQERRQSLVLHLQTEAHLVVDHAERSQLGQNGEQSCEVSARRSVLIHVSSQRVYVELLDGLNFLRVDQVRSLCFSKRGGRLVGRQNTSNIRIDFTMKSLKLRASSQKSRWLLTAEYHDDRQQGILGVVHLQEPHVLTEVEYLVTVVANRGRPVVLSVEERERERIRMVIW